MCQWMIAACRPVDWSAYQRQNCWRSYLWCLADWGWGLVSVPKSRCSDSGRREREWLWSESWHYYTQDSRYKVILPLPSDSQGSLPPQAAFTATISIGKGECKIKWVSSPLGDKLLPVTLHCKKSVGSASIVSKTKLLRKKKWKFALRCQTTTADAWWVMIHSHVLPINISRTFWWHKHTHYPLIIITT